MKSCKGIILAWLKECASRARRAGASSFRFRSSDLETKCRAWGQRIYGKTYLASNYRRRFREIRADRDYTEATIDDIYEIDTDDQQILWQARLATAPSDTSNS